MPDIPTKRPVTVSTADMPNIAHGLHLFADGCYHPHARQGGWAFVAYRNGVEIASGCIYISGAVEYDDRPGPIRESLVAMVRAWQGALLRSVEQSIATGDLKADTDAQQLVYEMYGLILALHHDARFLRVPGSIERAQAGFIRLLASYQNSVTSK